MSNLIIDNININPKIIEDNNISFKALGIYVYLKKIEKEKGTIYTADFKNAKSDGVTAIGSGIKELISNGYLERIQIRENGKLQQYQYAILDDYNDVDFDTFLKDFLEETKEENNNGNTTMSGNYKDDDIHEDFHKFTRLWEENIGLLSSTVGKWLLVIANKVDYEVFEEAIFEAISKGVARHDYVKKILDGWIAEGVTNMEQLNKIRKTRNDKFEEATLKRVEKAPNRTNKTSLTGTNTRQATNKASKIVARQEIKDILRQQEVKTDGEIEQNFDAAQQARKKLQEFRARQKGSKL